MLRTDCIRVPPGDITRMPVLSEPTTLRKESTISVRLALACPRWDQAVQAALLDTALLSLNLRQYPAHLVCAARK